MLFDFHSERKISFRNIEICNMSVNFKKAFQHSCTATLDTENSTDIKYLLYILIFACR